MLITLLTFLLISNALSIRKDKSILFFRIVMVSLGLTSIFVIYNIYLINLNFKFLIFICYISSSFTVFALINNNKEVNKLTWVKSFTSMLEIFLGNKIYFAILMLSSYILTFLCRSFVFYNLDNYGLIFDFFTVSFIYITLYPIILLIHCFVFILLESIYIKRNIFSIQTIKLILTNTYKTIEFKHFFFCYISLITTKYLILPLLCFCFIREVEAMAPPSYFFTNNNFGIKVEAPDTPLSQTEIRESIHNKNLIFSCVYELRIKLNGIRETQTPLLDFEQDKQRAFNNYVQARYPHGDLASKIAAWDPDSRKVRITKGHLDILTNDLNNDKLQNFKP